jgi:hypothetical protein
MSESADSIGSTKLSGLLRSSPDLRQYIKNIRSLYKVIEGGTSASVLYHHSNLTSL